jgi:o-succinylbenzoate synthase
VIDQVLIRPYALALRRAWGSSQGGFDRRHGWLIRVSADGLHGFGDCAPLPVAGTESAALAGETLRLIQRLAPGRPVEELLSDFGTELAVAPAARFGLDCALCDLLTQRCSLPLRQWLSSSAGDEVPVNAMLGTIGSVTPEGVLTACAVGFRVLKIKVGCGTLVEEIERLNALADHLPDNVRLRLDANGAWELDAARTMIEQLARLPIECLEEPLRQPDSEHFAALQALASFPLARDESLQDLGTELDPARLGVRRLVLKPAVIGGLHRTLNLARRAMATGIEVVVTSVVDSAAGLWPTAQLAAAIASSIPHGLATADWLAEDLGPAPHPQMDRIAMPMIAGSGFSPRP